MTLDQGGFLAKARSSVGAARLLLSQGYPDYAASRAYYAMFYLAQAYLIGQGKEFSRHSAVISAFGRDVVHARRVPDRFHRYLIEAYQARQVGDYDSPGTISERSAQAQIERAAEFLQTAEQDLA
jgi:uncharacterized protein (UPF0332 family)